ncbi:MAG: hypothetical protein IPG58_16510 [Acidobacteria bacterium]|nr:hypothetical protein [Acidobacteriota bacterium]
MDWGLFKDQKADYSMTMSKLAWMFERVTDTEAVLKAKAEKDQEYGRKKGYKKWSEAKYKQRTTEILGKRFALLGFDSCVLSTLEISSQFEGLTDTIVSSEGSIPTAGWNYAQILLGKIRDESERDPRAIAVSFVDQFIKQQSNFSLADISVDMAAWNMAAMPDLRKAFSRWALALSECFEDERSTEYNQFADFDIRPLAVSDLSTGTTCRSRRPCDLIIAEIDMLQNEIDAESVRQVGHCSCRVSGSPDRVAKSHYRDRIFRTGLSVLKWNIDILSVVLAEL